MFNELRSISKADYGDFGALKIQESAIAVSALSGELQASTLMMNGFSEAETRTILSVNGLSDAEIEQALAFAQSGESIRLYNAEVIKAGLQNSVLSSTEQKLVLDKLGFIDATTGELISTKQVSQAKLEEALINAGLEASEASVTAERIVSTVTQGTQKASIEAILALTKKQIVENAKYIASMVAAHPVATALGIALAALGGTVVYNTHKEQEYQKVLKDSVDTMSSATSEYYNSASKLDELVEKYKSLEKQLSLTNLTEEEIYQIKSDLYDVQCDLINNFGNEAKGIDLVNGKYREQLGLLQQINKEAAESYLTKNKEDYDNNMSYLTDKEDFRNKYTSDWSSKNSGYMSDDLKNILEANGLIIDAETWRSELGGAFTKYYVGFEDVTREEAYNLAMQLGEVLRKAGEDNADLMQDPYYDLVQSYLSYVTTELIDESELNSAQENADYYEKLSAMYSSSFGDLYNSFIDARDNYLKALQTGENVDTAKINFDNIYGEFQNSSKMKSDEVRNAFDDIKNSIDEEFVKLNDWEQSLSGSNELNVISALKVTDDQLRGINWDDEFTSPAEDAFGNLLTYLGVSRKDIEQVISLLVKMGAVIGEVQSSTLNFENPIPLSISGTIDQLNTNLKPTFDSLKSACQSIFTEDGFTLENVDLSMLDSIKSKLDELNENEELGIRIDYSSFENLAKVLTDTSSESDDVQKAFDSFATSVLNSTGVMDSMDESTVQLVASMLESMGIANANEAAYEALNAKMEGLALQEQFLAETGKELADAAADDAAEFLNHAGASAIAKTYLFQLVAAEQVFNAQGLDVSGKIEKLKELATAYGQTAIVAKIAHMEDQNAKSHTSFTDSDYQMLIDEVNSAVNAVQVDFGNIGGSSKSAGNAGKEAADAYLEAFEKELKDLDDLKDRGKITEKQYLDALRQLYLKYFNQKKKYLKEYEKYEHQYLDGMKSLYESAFSYITKQIGQRIDALGNEKDAAVSGLEAERDASLKAIEAEKEQHENEIKGIEKQIDAKEKEIKAMQDANAERKRAIDLQKAEYELQRMQNQRSSLVYKDGQMSYETDASGIRDAKQEVEDKKLETDISKIEKEIGLLEEEKDLLQERIDLLDKEADRINEYYDKLIANTEKQYDAMIKGLEDYKSQFEELTELLETAQMEATLSELGINMDALLSGSQEEFEKLKTAYIGILADMNRGNDGVLDQLSRLSGISAESVSYLDATRGALEGLRGVTLEGLEESVDGIGESVSTLSTSAGEASAAVGNIQTGVNTASQSIEPLNQELGSLKTLIGELIELLNGIQFPEISDEGYVQKLKDTAQAFGEIASKCAAFQSIDFSSIIGSASASGIDSTTMPVGEGAEGQTGTGFLGLASAISEAVAMIDKQMASLKTALDIGNDAFTEQIRVIAEEYIPAWEELQTRLAEIIGIGGGDGERKGEGNQKSGSKDGGSESGGNGGSIIDIMQTGGEEVAARLEDPWLKAFNDFATDGDNSIQSICDKIIGLVTEMARIIQEQCEAAANSLRSLAETASSLSSVGGSVSRNTVSSNTISVALYAEGTAGKAFAKGTGKYKGLPHHEKYALRSEYGQPELTVYPDGKAELTTEPVMSDLPKGTVIFNEEQTKRIMENKGEIIGNAYDDGTIILPDGTKARPLNSNDEPYWIQKKFESYFKENRDTFLRPSNAMLQASESMNRLAETIHNNNIMKQNIHVDVGGVHVHGVQNPEEFSDVVNLRIHNKILQEINKW